jgi:hypothetical protein
MSVLKKGPDVAQAAKVGDPTLTDPTPVSANQLAGDTTRKVMGSPAGEHGLGAEIVKGAAPAANEPAPRSDATRADSQPFARPSPAADPNELKPAATDPNELKPSGATDPNELKPTAPAQTSTTQTAATQTAVTDAALPPPVQVNEIQQGPAPSGSEAGASSSSSLASDKDVSSSKKKKKKGLKKIIAF